jgi:outer membrane protein OmpA-like peptidoglycan-associated protein
VFVYPHFLGKSPIFRLENPNPADYHLLGHNQFSPGDFLMTFFTNRFTYSLCVAMLLAACSHQEIASIAPGPDDKNKIPGIEVNGRAHPFVGQEKPQTSQQVYEVPTLKPLPPPVPKPVQVVPLPIQEEIYFRPNSAWIAPSAKAVIKTWVKTIETKHLKKVLLIGHTDPSGKEFLNKKLSLKRAAVVRWMIKKMGVKDVRIYLRAVGDKPKDGFHRCKSRDWKCYARNRAVRFIELDGPKKSAP